MFARLLLVFTVVPIVELLLLVELGRVVGLASTLLVVIGTGVLGATLARLEGLRTARALRAELEAGRMPSGQLLDAGLILAAGALLLTPGLLTDGLGLFLLAPPGRALVRRTVARAIRRRLGLGEVRVIDAEWSHDDRGGAVEDRMESGEDVAR